MLKINLPPHWNTGFHIHTSDSVSVNIEEAEMANQLPGEEPTPRVPGAGRPNFTAYSERGREPMRPRTWERQPFTSVRSCLTTLSPLGSRDPRDPVFWVIGRSWITNECAAGALCWIPAKPRLPLSRLRPDCASCSMVGNRRNRRRPTGPRHESALGESYWQEPGMTRAIRNVEAPESSSSSSN